jgi:hypothetical protein
MVYEIDHVSQDGTEVNLYVPGTNLQRFRVHVDTLTFVECKPPAKTSNAFTNPEPVFDADEVLERIAMVQMRWCVDRLLRYAALLRLCASAVSLIITSSRSQGS